MLAAWFAVSHTKAYVTLQTTHVDDIDTTDTTDTTGWSQVVQVHQHA